MEEIKDVLNNLTRCASNVIYSRKIAEGSNKITPKMYSECRERAAEFNGVFNTINRYIGAFNLTKMFLNVAEAIKTLYDIQCKYEIENGDINESKLAADFLKVYKEKMESCN